jgi:hypothetical protein
MRLFNRHTLPNSARVWLFAGIYVGVEPRVGIGGNPRVPSVGGEGDVDRIAGLPPVHPGVASPCCMHDRGWLQRPPLEPRTDRIATGMVWPAYCPRMGESAWRPSYTDTVSPPWPADACEHPRAEL